MRWLFALVMVSVSAVAGEKAPASRTSALVVAADAHGEALALRLEEYMNASIKEYAHLKLRSTDDLFGVGIDAEAVAALKRADLGFQESKASFLAKTYDDAEVKLRATIKEYAKAVPSMKSCGNLCDAMALYAGVLHARGDTEEAKLQLLDFISLAPQGKDLDKKIFPADFVELKRLVGESRNAQLRGNVTVKTKPEGARVYVNSEFVGYSPMTVPTLPIGKALIRFERPGFVQTAILADVTPEDSEVTTQLTATQAYAAYDNVADKLANEAVKDKGGAAMTRVSSSLGIDRAVVAVIKGTEDGEATNITLAYCDLKSGKRYSVRKVAVQGDEYGQLKGEVGRLVNALINTAEGPSERVSRSSDPLDHKEGYEDWKNEDRGGRDGLREKKSKGTDPLDGVDGTSGW